MAVVGPFVLKAAAAFALGRIASSLLSKSPQRDGSSSALLGLPVGNTDSGPPRVWAIGNRVRVPAQVMWQERKVRDQAFGPKKGGGSIQHISYDVAFMLNDRPTSRLIQFITNDELLLWASDSRNLVRVETSAMTPTTAAGQVILTMNSLLEEDFTDQFEVGDIIELQNFVVVTGPTLNVGFWKVAAVVGHTTTPSVLTLDIYSNQTVAGLNSNAGNPFAPAAVIRVDDQIVGDGFTLTQNAGLNITKIEGTTKVEWWRVLNTPEQVELAGGFSPQVLAPGINAGSAGTNFVWVGPGQYTGTPGSATDGAVIRAINPRTTASGFFPPTFNPLNHYFAGTDTQIESSIIAGHEGAGNVGGFRGTAYQVFDDLDVTNFGGALPPATEALLQVDTSMDWATAIREVAIRGGMSANNLDASGVTPRPFRGYYIRGPVSGIQALTPLLLAGQIATQERGGVLAFFDVDNADVVAIQNGAVFSDFGAQVSQPILEKWKWSLVDPDDLPSAVGVRFQDPASNYGTNYETFGKRFPSSIGETHVEELDVRTLVLTRREARNLASTLARRAHISSTSVAFSLPATYLHVLENDLLTWTDDEGEVHTVRVVSRTLGANFVVQIEAVVELVGLAVSGSPVQSGAGVRVDPPTSPASVEAHVFDAPPVRDDWGLTPGYHVVAGAASAGGPWGGATVFLSTDGGANFVERGVIEVEHPIGYLETALAAATASEVLGSSTLVYDTVSTVTVEFSSVGPIPILTVSTTAVESGWNWFAILDAGRQVLEVFAARDVVANSPTNYTFSHLLRGLRGTWQGSAAGHAAGLSVVGLSMLYFEASGEFRDLPGQASPLGLQFRIVPAGGELAVTPTQGLATRFRNVEPFALRDIRKSYDGSNNRVRFEARHWTRTNVSLGKTGPYPLDESYEVLRFTLFHQSGNGQAVYTRTKSAQNSGARSLRDPSVEFTYAEQIAAGYSPGPSETYWIDAVQIGQFGTESPSVYQEL